MSDPKRKAIDALSVVTETFTTYPPEFRREVAGRSKRVLGDPFGLTGFGVNLVDLPPGSWSAQRHWHTHEDELVYVVAGELVLVTDDGEQTLTPGMVIGFPAGAENGHHLVNKGDAVATYLEVGSRIAEDEVFYPDIDLQLVHGDEPGRRFTHRDGQPYE